MDPKLPPQDLEAEQSVLGSLMIDKHAIIKVVDFLLPIDFYKPAHHKIYEAILKLFEKNEPIDILSVGAQLKKNKTLEPVGGSAYLAELVNAVPTAANVNHYATIVRQKRILRDLINFSAEVSEKAFKESEFEPLIDIVEQRVFNLSQHSRPRRLVHIKPELDAAFNRLEKLSQQDGTLRGLRTGFTKLDNCLSGLQKSDLIILGARPSSGKTALALDIARQAALLNKMPIGIFSIEMSKEQVIDRLIAAEADVPLWRLRTGKLKEDEGHFARIQGALGRLSETSIFIDDAPSPNIFGLRSAARRLQLEHGLGLLVIDYLQLIQPRTSSDSMVQQITEISRGLKTLARELDIPVLALSQLSREVDKRGDRPRLSDLRESGSIEQDADVVIFIHRKNRLAQNNDAEEQNPEIIIAKHRNGPTEDFELSFDKEKASFRNLDTIHREL